MGEIAAIFSGTKRGGPKEEVEKAVLIKDREPERDGRTGFFHRVKLLAVESAAGMRAPDPGAVPEDFAVNLVTRGIDPAGLPEGTRLLAGAEAILRVSRTGKERRDHRALQASAGNRVAPHGEIFGEVLRGGPVRRGDSLRVQPRHRFAVITVSDKGAAGERADKSGPLLGELLRPWGDVDFSLIVPDERAALVAELRRMAEKEIDAVFTSGGTGLAPRDITPEATLEVSERLVPGIAEAMRRETFSATPRAALSRAVAGISGRTLIVNLPGSPRAVRQCFAVLEPILGHALETLTGRGSECGAE